jgi:hypothetical protein
VCDADAAEEEERNSSGQWPKVEEGKGPICEKKESLGGCE